MTDGDIDARINTLDKLRRHFANCEPYKHDLKLVMSFDDDLPTELEYCLEERLYVGKMLDEEYSLPSCMRTLHASVDSTFTIVGDSSLPDGVAINRKRGNMYGTPLTVYEKKIIIVEGTFRSNAWRGCEVRLQAEVVVEVPLSQHIEELTTTNYSKIRMLQDQLGLDPDMNIKDFIEKKIERICLKILGKTTRPRDKLVSIKEIADDCDWHLYCDWTKVLTYAASLKAMKKSPKLNTSLLDDDNSLGILLTDGNEDDTDAARGKYQTCSLAFNFKLQRFVFILVTEYERC